MTSWVFMQLFVKKLKDVCTIFSNNFFCYHKQNEYDRSEEQFMILNDYFWYHMIKMESKLYSKIYTKIINKTL